MDFLRYFSVVFPFEIFRSFPSMCERGYSHGWDTCSSEVIGLLVPRREDGRSFLGPLVDFSHLLLWHERGTCRDFP